MMEASRTMATISMASPSPVLLEAVQLHRLRQDYSHKTGRFCRSMVREHRRQAGSKSVILITYKVSQARKSSLDLVDLGIR